MRIFLRDVDNLKNVKYFAKNGSLVRILPFEGFAPACCSTLPYIHHGVHVRISQEHCLKCFMCESLSKANEYQEY